MVANTRVQMIMTWLITSVWLFPGLLPAVTFSVYIGFGNYLTFSYAAASLVLFNLIKGPLIQAPIFYGDLVQLFVSVRRIQSFLECDEV